HREIEIVGGHIVLQIDEAFAAQVARRLYLPQRTDRPGFLGRTGREIERTRGKPERLRGGGAGARTVGEAMSEREGAARRAAAANICCAGAGTEGGDRLGPRELASRVGMQMDARGQSARNGKEIAVDPGDGPRGPCLSL